RLFCVVLIIVVFFFQAEDGIRDDLVTGVQTCALPISPLDPILQFNTAGKLLKSFGKGLVVSPHKITIDKDGNVWVADNGAARGRSEERRVGKERRSPLSEQPHREDRRQTQSNRRRARE